MFASRGLLPPRVCEADQEDARHSLVSAGLGLGLMSEDLTQAAERAGELFIWPGHMAHTTLWLVYQSARDSEPTIAALRAVLRQLWSAPESGDAEEERPTNG